MKEASVEIVSDTTCEKRSGSYSDVVEGICMTFEASNSGTISDDMVCAGGAGTGKDACRGDSGGPLTVKEGDKLQHTLVGVVSSGHGCGEVSSIWMSLI